MVLMVRYLSHTISETKISKYFTLFWINIIGAYIMIVSFIIQGYGFVSILFSTIEQPFIVKKIANKIVDDSI